MKKSISLWQFVGFAFVSLFGTILHFLYDWTGENKLAALISGVNESTFEHMKLLFFPLFIFAIIENRIFSEEEAFWCIKLKGTLYGLALIPIIFYTLNGAFGETPDFVNISIFYISAAAVFLYETKQWESGEVKCKRPYLAFAALCLIALLFFIFTFNPPRLPLFADPINGSFGVKV